MPLCPQITNTPITVTQTGDFTVSSIVPLIGDTKDGIASNISTTATEATNAFNTANTALTNAATAYSAAIGSLQPSASTIVNASNQMTAIAANGITVYSGSSSSTGARVVMNSLGLAGYDASNNATFSISATTGAAVFSGSVTGSTITGGSLNIAGNAIINSSGFLTATGATITGTINASGGYIGSATNGWIFNASGYLVNSGLTTFLYPSTAPGGNANTYALYSDRGVLCSVVQVQSSSTTALYAPSGGLNVGLGITAAGSAFVVSSAGAITSVGNITSSGSLSTGSGSFVVNSTGNMTSVGTITASGLITANNGVTVAGAPIYTGTATTTASSQTEGIALTQGGTINARRSNNNPLNVHIFDVTVGATTSVAVIQFIRNGTNRGTLEIFGNTTAPTLVGSSDYRLKENIRDYSGALDKLMATKVRVFNEIEDEDKNDIVGFVAHEFAEIFPDFVGGEKDAVDEEGNPIYQKLGYGNLVPHLVRAIQELKAEIDQLKGA